eukprot:3976275-Amphidinium_carterae.1
MLQTEAARRGCHGYDMHSGSALACTALRSWTFSHLDAHVSSSRCCLTEAWSYILVLSCTREGDQ